MSLLNVQRTIRNFIKPPREPQGYHRYHTSRRGTAAIQMEKEKTTSVNKHVNDHNTRVIAQVSIHNWFCPCSMDSSGRRPKQSGASTKKNKLSNVAIKNRACKPTLCIGITPRCDIFGTLVVSLVVLCSSWQSTWGPYDLVLMTRNTRSEWCLCIMSICKLCSSLLHCLIWFSRWCLWLLYSSAWWVSLARMKLVTDAHLCNSCGAVIVNMLFDQHCFPLFHLKF